MDDRGARCSYAAFMAYQVVVIVMIVAIANVSVPVKAEYAHLLAVCRNLASLLVGVGEAHKRCHAYQGESYAGKALFHFHLYKPLVGCFACLTIRIEVFFHIPYSESRRKGRIIFPYIQIVLYKISHQIYAFSQTPAPPK